MASGKVDVSFKEYLLVKYTLPGKETEKSKATINSECAIRLELSTRWRRSCEVVEVTVTPRSTKTTLL